MNDDTSPRSSTDADQVSEDAQPTDRETERSTEDSEFAPVIVKRIDIAVRHPDDTLELAIAEGIEQCKRSGVSLLLSSIAAGAILAFTALAVGVASSMADGDLPLPARLATACVYPLGFVLCLMSGTQLFTEHTALAVYPVLDRKQSIPALARVWITVFAGNIAGCLLGALLLAGADGVIGAADGYAAIAQHMIGFGWFETLLSAVLAGWLMAVGGWLVLSTPPDASQLLVIYVVTFLIGFGGMHHSIAGTAELLAAIFTGAELSLATACKTIGIAAIGNLIGGGLFVAALNYGHIRKTQSKETFA